MAFENYHSRHLRDDSTRSSHFLSVLIKALAKQDLLGRMPVQPVLPRADLSHSIVYELIENKPEISEAIEMMMDPTILIRNLTAYVLRPTLKDLHDSLTQYLRLLLREARVNFNRPLLIVQEAQPERYELFSEAFVALGQLVSRQLNVLAGLEREFTVFVEQPCLRSARTEEVDRLVATSCEFTSIQRAPFLNLAMLDCQSSCLAVLTTIRNTIDQLFSLQDAQKIKPSDLATLDALSSEIQQLTQLRIPKSNSLPTLEAYRLTLCRTMYLGHKMIASLLGGIEELVASIKQDSPPQFTSDLKRATLVSLARGGSQTKAGKRILEAMIAYCRKHQTAPDQILDGELRKIDSNLTPDTLQTFQQSWHLGDPLTISDVGGRKGRVLSDLAHLEGQIG